MYRSGKRSCEKIGSDFRRWNGDYGPKSPIASAKASTAPPAKIAAASSARMSGDEPDDDEQRRTSRRSRLKSSGTHVLLDRREDARKLAEQRERRNELARPRAPSATTPIVAPLFHGASHARALARRDRRAEPRREDRQVAQERRIVYGAGYVPAFSTIHAKKKPPSSRQRHDSSPFTKQRITHGISSKPRKLIQPSWRKLTKRSHVPKMTAANADADHGAVEATAEAVRPLEAHHHEEHDREAPPVRDAEDDPQEEVRREERVLGSGDARRAAAPVRVPRRELTPAEERHAIGLLPRVELVVVHPVGELERIAQDALVDPRGDRDPDDEAQDRHRREAVGPAPA